MFYFYFFLSVEKINKIGDIFYKTIYVFTIVELIDLEITLDTIFYKNNLVIEVDANIYYYCATKKLPLVNALNLFFNVFFIFSNPLANESHKFIALE